MTKQKEGFYEMKKISILAVIVSLTAMIGIVGGVENGEPLINMLWCIPCLASVCIFAKLGGLVD